MDWMNADQVWGFVLGATSIASVVTLCCGWRIIRETLRNRKAPAPVATATEGMGKGSRQVYHNLTRITREVR